MAVRAAHPAQLVELDFLTPIFGNIKTIERTVLATVGFTGARHERLTLQTDDGLIRLVLKHRNLANDWAADLLEDYQGREALLLDEPRLAGVWHIFESPYVAYAFGEQQCAVLMNDVSDYLLPDGRESLRIPQENALLTALASLHARYWESSVLDLRWLARTRTLVDVLSATRLRYPAGLMLAAPQFRDAVLNGWRTALDRVSPHVGDLLTMPGTEVERLFRHLPITLLHGDAKVANFAVLPDSRVFAFDWTVLAAAPCALEVGWYIAVNATRLTTSKDRTLQVYRGLLEQKLGRPLSESTWHSMREAAIIGGARMFLWSKANALAAGTARAQHEWEWWTSRLHDVTLSETPPSGPPVPHGMRAEASHHTKRS